MTGEVRFRSIKSEIRVFGLSNFVSDPKNRGKSIVVGVVYRGRLWIDGVMWTSIRDGEVDATKRVATMITSSPHRKQLRVIVTEKRTVEGAHPINLGDLFKLTGLPVIVLTRGLKWDRLIDQILTAGINKDDAARIIKMSSATGTTPEALRVANMIAKCLTKLVPSDRR